MISINDCRSLNDIARKLFGEANYTNREKCKLILLENGIDWKKWLAENRKPNKCLFCGKEIEGKYRFRKKFCNSSCAAKYNNVKRNESKQQNIEERRCKNCGKVLIRKDSVFCSIKCQKENSFKEYIERWKNGEEDGMKGEYGISNHIKLYLMQKFDCKCERCGWSEVNKYTGKIPLEVHHKDGDYTNNSEDNLQLLCPNCHSLTENYKSHNKSGRKNRKKYCGVEQR